MIPKPFLSRKQSFPKSPPHPCKTSGFALVLVLVTLVLVVVMITFFLASATRERSAVSLHEGSAKNQSLADTAVSLVIGAINSATKEGANAGEPRSWTSQPGMLRTFNQSGNLSRVYKLYSWDNLVEADGAYDPFSTVNQPPDNWAARTAHFTDLNSPNAEGMFPILDPGALGKVDGFSYDNATTAVPEIPMPVKWLYILADGRRVIPSDDGTTTATIPGSSANNPVIGRIAYWTDDETCKVNINTASEGAYWDWPKAATRDEMQFAGNPPRQGEFQRTAGHPAMTSLSSVLTELDPGPRWAASGSLSTSYREKLNAIYDLLPRTSKGGSEGGTMPVNSLNFDYAPATTAAASYVTPPFSVPKGKRMFASPSEMIFTDQMTTEREKQLAPSLLNERSFFLTSASRAPETTLFETPRISLWPVTWPNNSNYFDKRTWASAPSGFNPNSSGVATNPWMAPQERLLAFAASLNTARNNTSGGAGEDRYYFQRQNPDSADADWQGIERNRALTQYLKDITSNNIPGFGGKLDATHGSGNRDLILANTLNHVRSSVNQYTLANSDSANNATLLYSYTPIAFRGRRSGAGAGGAVNWREPNAFRAVPLRVSLGGPPIQTTGNFPVLRSATVLFFAKDRVLPSRKIPTDPGFMPAVSGENPYLNPFNWNNLINNGTTPSPDYPTGARTTQMQAVLLLNFANDARDNAEAGGSFWLRVGGGSFRVNGSPIGLPKRNPITTQYHMGIVDFMGAPPIRYLFEDSATAKEIRNDSSSHSVWSLVSDTIAISPDALDFNFAGSEITVDVVPPRRNINTDSAAAGDAAIATYTLDFGEWNGIFPIPIAPRWVWSAPQQADSATWPRPNNDVSVAVGQAARVADYKTTRGPAEPSIPPTQWATAEIASASSSSAVTDPATDIGSGQRVNRSLYAFQDKNGVRLMTDFRNRLWMSNNRIGGGAPWSTQYPYAEGDSGDLAANRLMPATWVDAKTIISPYDVAISLVIDPAQTGNGDPRLGNRFSFARIDNVYPGSPRQVLDTSITPTRTAGKQFHMIPASMYHPWATGYASVVVAPQLLSQAIRNSNIEPFNPVHGNPNRLMARYGWGNVDSGAAAVGLMGRAAANSFGDTTGARNIGLEVYADVNRDFSGRSVLGDWSSAPGNRPDGGIIPRLDQDFQGIHQDQDTNVATLNIPFFVGEQTDESAALGNFSPNRQIPSPITILGSLPSSQTTGWQTLLFSPNPAIGSSHPGLSANAPDHLWLDLFWMPVAEPYPISEQFSTAGKINLNHQILPFANIERTTALHAAMKSTMITAFDSSLSGVYKAHFHARDATGSKSRYAINIPETLNRFDTEVFDNGDVFRSASQLSEKWLVPEGRTAGDVEAFWSDKLLTSDTAREAPYDHLYSRVTTKSNTYTVHWKVQALRQTPASAAAGTWNESRDRVISELEGATLIERYLDPNATDIPDYATDLTKIVSDPLSNYYRWRIVSNNLFRR